MEQQTTARSARTPAGFLQDLRRAAEAAGIVPDRRAMADAVAPFADLFCTQPVELRTTSVPGERREVSFRFVDETAHGRVWEIARSWFELSGAPRDFMDAVHKTFKVRAEGIDADVQTGFRKDWAFLAAGHPLERFAALDGAPPALKRVRDVLAHHGLHSISIVGTDHHNKTCNLYPMLAPGWANRDVIREVARALDFAPMDESWLEHIERSVAGNFTFSWSGDSAQRMCFYRPAMTLEDVPNDPVLRRFAAECPIVAAQRVFIPSVTWARTGHYRKLEVDYDGNIVGVLVRATQVPTED